MAFCENCGTQLSNGAKFCSSCGKPAGAGASSTASTPSQTSNATMKWILAGGVLLGLLGVGAALYFSHRSSVSQTPEAQAAQGYREAIVKAHEDSTLRTKAYTGKTCRVIRTEYALEWEKDPSKIQPFPLQAQTSTRNGVMNYTGRGGADVDPNRTFMPTGQGAGLIHEIKPAAEVFADLLRETEAALKKAQQLMSGDPVRQHSAAPPR